MQNWNIGFPFVDKLTDDIELLAKEIQLAVEAELKNLKQLEKLIYASQETNNRKI